MEATRKLVQLSYSPWSERARWALDHHGLVYRIVEHTPFLGELGLRKLVGRKKRPATVPVLVDHDTVLTDSWDIAVFADRIGSGAKLIPTDKEAEVRRWVDLADRTSSKGRTLVVAGLLASDAALDESLPFPLPAWLHATMRPVTRFGLRWFGRKYDFLPGALADCVSAMRPALDELRSAVATSPYLLGSFTYADIAMATLLQGISPVGNGYIRLGPATRRAWTQPTLEKDYPDLIRWRDNLYLAHRGRPVAPSSAA